MSIEFIDADAGTSLEDLITQFESALGITLYQGDERRIFLEQLNVVVVTLLNKINETGNQNLLEFATGDILDAIGERTDCNRNDATKATVTMRFNLSAAQSSAITISHGTLVTPDGKLFFTTTSDLVIPAGSLYGDVPAQAEAVGTAYNGFVAGQINQLVDGNIAYVASIANTTTSDGGTEEEADDDGTNTWSDYRERIRESPTAFSTAGPEDAYKYWAKTADSNIGDVSVTSPSDASVLITVLMSDGSVPSSTVLLKVETICSAKKRRPLTDKVTVAAPTSSSYDLTLTYYISEDNSAIEASIRSAIEDTDGTIDQYNDWQSAKLGRAINPDYLRQLMLNAGASRIVLTSPAYMTVADTAVAVLGTKTITYGGLE